MANHRDHLLTNGYVILDNVSEYEDRYELLCLSNELYLKNPNMCINGFFELYHDNTLAKIRQNPKMYNAFSDLLNEDKLWVVFDRIIYMKNEIGANILCWLFFYLLHLLLCFNVLQLLDHKKKCCQSCHIYLVFIFI